MQYKKLHPKHSTELYSCTVESRPLIMLTSQLAQSGWHHTCFLKPAAQYTRVNHIPDTRTFAALPAGTRVAVAAATAAAPNPSQPDPRARSEAKRAKQRQGPPKGQSVLQSGPAASTGALPDVLAVTFPDTFPTLSAARRGAFPHPQGFLASLLLSAVQCRLVECSHL